MSATGAGVLAGGVLSHHLRCVIGKSHLLKKVKCIDNSEFKRENGRLRLKEFSEQASDMIRSDGGGGIDGTGLGLVLNHQKLGEIFDIWCLHIPVRDRTPFTELVELVEKAVRSENFRSQSRPIYLVGESNGACLALSVAARNPDIDLILVLENPATSFRKSPLQPILPLLQIMPEQLSIIPHSILSLITGTPLKRVMAILVKGLTTHQTVGDLSVMADVLPRETLIWKLKMLSSASAYANSRLHAVKAQTLILSSERDLLLSSRQESERLCHVLPNSEIRKFKESGHALFLEDDVDLITILMGAGFFRRGRCVDYASDCIPPTPSEFYKIYKSTGEDSLQERALQINSQLDFEQ